MTSVSERINRRTSSPYVLISQVNGRATEEYSINADAKLILDYWPLLPAEMQAKFTAARAAEERKQHADREWAMRFLHACAENPRGPWPDRRGRWLIERDTMPLKMLALGAAWRAGEKGVTAPEVQRRFNIVSGGVPGALADLHAAGVLARLTHGKR